MAKGIMMQEGKGTSFLVKFDRLDDIKFRSCIGMNFGIEPIFFQEAGFNQGQRSSRGRISNAQIGFSYGTVDDKAKGSSVGGWIMGVMDLDKKLEKKDGRISLIDDEGNTIAKWKIKKAWPCRWEGPRLGVTESDLTIDSVTFVHEGIERIS